MKKQHGLEYYLAIIFDGEDQILLIGAQGGVDVESYYGIRRNLFSVLLDVVYGLPDHRRFKRWRLMPPFASRSNRNFEASSRRKSRKALSRSSTSAMPASNLTRWVRNAT